VPIPAPVLISNPAPPAAAAVFANTAACGGLPRTLPEAAAAAAAAAVGVDEPERLVTTPQACSVVVAWLPAPVLADDTGLSCWLVTRPELPKGSRPPNS
jgi:hypothetical protein